MICKIYNMFISYGNWVFYKDEPVEKVHEVYLSEFLVVTLVLIILTLTYFWWANPLTYISDKFSNIKFGCENKR